MSQLLEQLHEARAVHDSMVAVATAAAFQPAIVQVADELRRLAAGRTITLARELLRPPAPQPHCPPVLHPAGVQSAPPPAQPDAAQPVSHPLRPARSGNSKPRPLDAVERRVLTELMARHDGNVAAAARAEGINRQTLRHRVLRHGIPISHIRGPVPRPITKAN